MIKQILTRVPTIGTICITLLKMDKKSLTNVQMDKNQNVDEKLQALLLGDPRVLQFSQRNSP